MLAVHCTSLTSWCWQWRLQWKRVATRKMYENDSPQAQRVRRWSGGASVAPMLAGSRRKRRKVTSSGTETAHVEEMKFCEQHKRREDRGAVTTPVVGTRTDRKVDGSCICQYDQRHEEQRYERHGECDGGTDRSSAVIFSFLRHLCILKLIKISAGIDSCGLICCLQVYYLCLWAPSQAALRLWSKECIPRNGFVTDSNRFQLR